MISSNPHMLVLECTLSNQAVQVDVVRTLKTKVPAADVVDSFIVDHKRTIGVFKGGMGSKDGVVRLYNGGSGLGCWVNAEFQLDLLAKIDRQTLHEKSAEARSSSTTEGVEDEETLETSAIISNTANLVQNLIYQLLSDSVMTTSIVVGSILLASNHLLWVEQAAIGAGANFINDIGLKIAVDGSGDIFALTCSA